LIFGRYLDKGTKCWRVKK